MLNKAEIIGNLGAAPEIRYMQNGDPVANFSVATMEKWRDKATGENRESTEWHRITAFGKLAEICAQYLKKGSLVYISGKIVTKKYTDKAGIERYQTGITADNMKMLGPKEKQEAPQEDKESAPLKSLKSGFEDMHDDLPF